MEQLLLVEEIRPLAPHELLAKGRYIQLSSKGELSLADAERAFLKALELDPDYKPAVLELAWFFHSVNDQPSKALPLFEKAYRLSLSQLGEALAGRADAAAEVTSQPPEQMLGEFIEVARRELGNLRNED